MNSKISVIVPCYKQAEYLAECLQSVLTQTYENWECIIINDGSPDNTEEIALEWCKKDGRFIYFRKDNGGVSSARNTGIEKSSGDFILFLDCDDRIDQSKLEFSLNEIKNFDENNVVISNFRIFKTADDKTYCPYCVLRDDLFTFDSILMEWDKTFTTPIHCGLFSKKLLHNIRFPENLSAREDWIFWIEVYQKNPKTYFINLPLSLYRRNPFGATGNEKFMHENLLKAIDYVQQILSPNDYLKYLNHSLKMSLNQIIELENKITTILQYDNLHLSIRKGKLLSAFFKRLFR